MRFSFEFDVIAAPTTRDRAAEQYAKHTKRRHKDNTSSATAHRQFALSLNLNGTDEYDGGLLRFPEFGRELYAPVAGGALVFSTAMVHEVTPVTRGRRFGVFTFLSASGPAVIR